MDKKELERRMVELDEVVSNLYTGVEFFSVIVGDGALIINNIISRATLDVDVLEVSREVEEIFAAYDFNTRVKSLTFCFPYNYEDRLQGVDIKTKSIKYYTLALEDIIVSKLYAYRQKDIEDLKLIKESNLYDPILLDTVVKEAELSALNIRQYKEMVHLYKTFFERE